MLRPVPFLLSQRRLATIALGAVLAGIVLSPLASMPAEEAEELEAVGAAWFLRRVGEVRLVRLAGSSNGQESLLLLAPERGFALARLTNAAGGHALNHEVAAWALQHHFGVSASAPIPLALPAGRLNPPTGRYGLPGLVEIELTPHEGGLLARLAITGSIGDEPAATFYGADRLAALDEPFVGQLAAFARDHGGRVAWLRLGARLMLRRN